MIVSSTFGTIMGSDDMRSENGAIRNIDIPITHQQLAHESFEMFHDIFHGNTFRKALEIEKKVIEAIRHDQTFPFVVNEFGELPVTYLWRSYQWFFESYMNRKECIDKWESSLRPIWRAIIALIYGARLCQHDNPPLAANENILHAAAATNCPTDLICFILTVFPDLVRQVDGYGRLPLHLACYSRNSHLDTEIEEYDQFWSSTATDSYQRSHQGKIDLILNAYREGAHHFDQDGHLPLLIAINNGKTWIKGVGDLVNANFCPLTSGLTISGLLVFQISACKSDPDLNTIYNLLRAHPEQIFRKN